MDFEVVVIIVLVLIILVAFELAFELFIESVFTIDVIDIWLIKLFSIERNQL